MSPTRDISPSVADHRRLSSREDCENFTLQAFHLRVSTQELADQQLDQGFILSRTNENRLSISNQLRRTLFFGTFSVMFIQNFFTETQGAGCGFNVFVRRNVLKRTLEAKA